MCPTYGCASKRGEESCLLCDTCYYYVLRQYRIAEKYLNIISNPEQTQEEFKKRDEELLTLRHKIDNNSVSRTRGKVVNELAKRARESVS
jgi:hypothetical protein